MNPKVGDVAIGTVVKVFPTYAILLFDEGWTGLLHISELSSSYIRSFTSFVTIGSVYNVKVIAVDEQTGATRVSLKQMGAVDRKKLFRHKKIEPSEIDFSDLEKRLPEWIKAENQGESL